ncbi:DUF4382 domain-containing protein [Flavobacterium ponti]|uniref:DUF4382 domain-containing protein n=1 Tax=Flavobacterium ponti TaxID=665133 RepID=A0ABV9P6Y1_9FLAO
MKKTFLLLTLLFSSLVIMVSCSDDDNSNAESYAYSVRLTDAPGPYDAVYIDVQGVEVIGNNGVAVNLATQTGIYDLLELSSGVETTLSNDVITASKVNQVRLILGTENSVVVDGVSYPLDTPSAQQSGLKLQVNQTLDANTQNSILIDFDANKSIVVNGNGTYTLKPVLRTIDLSTTGTIEGSISIPGTLASVQVVSSTGNEVYTNVKADGTFKVLGLAPGTYTVTITPVLPFLPAIKSNVTVETGATTNIGEIIIQ